MEIQEPKWIVKDAIPAGTMVLLAGDAGVGKSSFNLTEALYLAMGWDWMGRKTTQTKVLYFDEENSKPDLYAYLQRSWIGMGCPDVQILDEWLHIEHFSLGGRGWAIEMERIARDWRPGLIYIDTASSALAIIDENDNAEAQRTVKTLRDIMRTAGPDTSLKILKHAKFQQTKKNDDRPHRTIRGAKAWLGAVDQTMYHIRLKGRPKKDGLGPTCLVPDKSRGFGLKDNILITPEWTDEAHKAWTFKGETFVTKTDLLEVHE